MYTLPTLPYSFDSLEPYIDTRTMEIHYTKHHQTYLDKFNAILTKHPELEQTPVEELLKKLSTLPIDEADKTAIRNSGGGFANHSFFWTILGKTKTPDTVLIERITKTFGSLDMFKERFSTLAANHFGSGWVWLVEDENKNLQIYATPNQDSPYGKGHTPILTIDLWEHAYYLLYQNRRAEYIKNWWNVVTILP